MMDVVLRTNSNLERLELRGLKLFADRSGGTCTLFVQSGSFGAAVPFSFDLSPWETFLKGLRFMERDLRGSAKVGPIHEEQYIQLAMGSLGRVVVSGLLIEYTDRMQRLEFKFHTDQTVLSGFISDLLEASGDVAA